MTVTFRIDRGGSDLITHWNPVVYVGSETFVPAGNLSVQAGWVLQDGITGLLDMRIVALAGRNGPIISRRNTFVQVVAGGTYLYHWDSNRWETVSEPAPTPEPPPPPEPPPGPEPPPPPITPGGFFVWITLDEGGVVTGVPWVAESGGLKAGPYASGTTIQLTAVANPGFVFSGWIVNDEWAGSIPTINLLVTTTLFVTPGFSESELPIPPLPVGEAEFSELTVTYGGVV